MGDGPVLNTMIQEYGYQPAMTPDLTADQAKALGSEGIKGLLISGVAVMPNFSKLLNNEEMDLVTDYVVGCIQGNDPQKCH
jgi:mono/diheme cytochrome c family protein